jgi:hypothetical protein
MELAELVLPSTFQVARPLKFQVTLVYWVQEFSTVVPNRRLLTRMEGFMHWHRSEMWRCERESQSAQ